MADPTRQPNGTARRARPARLRLPPRHPPTRLRSGRHRQRRADVRGRGGNLGDGHACSTTSPLRIGRAVDRHTRRRRRARGGLRNRSHTPPMDYGASTRRAAAPGRGGTRGRGPKGLRRTRRLGRGPHATDGTRHRRRRRPDYGAGGSRCDPHRQEPLEGGAHMRQDDHAQPRRHRRPATRVHRRDPEPTTNGTHARKRAMRRTLVGRGWQTVEDHEHVGRDERRRLPTGDSHPSVRHERTRRTGPTAAHLRRVPGMARGRVSGR